MSERGPGNFERFFSGTLGVVFALLAIPVALFLLLAGCALLSRATGHEVP
jgi:hypothetical protein